MKNNPKRWVGCDLDSTLAYHDNGSGVGAIGEPIPAMVELVKAYLAKGIQVKIMTARVGGLAIAERLDIEEAIQDWCEKHIGQRLPVTAEKDLNMIALYDDRCIQVEPNTGVGMVDYYKDAADTMNGMLEDIRKVLGVARQDQIMPEIRRLVK